MEGPSGPDRALAACVHRRDLGEDQHGAPAGLGDEGTTAEGLCAPRPLEDPDLHRRAAPRPDRCALGDRRADQRQNLPPTSRKSSPRPSRPAMSLFWTTSAATKARPPAPSSETKAPTSSFCRP